MVPLCATCHRCDMAETVARLASHDISGWTDKRRLNRNGKRYFTGSPCRTFGSVGYAPELGLRLHWKPVPGLHGSEDRRWVGAFEVEALVVAVVEACKHCLPGAYIEGLRFVRGSPMQELEGRMV